MESAFEYSSIALALYKFIIIIIIIIMFAFWLFGNDVIVIVHA